MFCSVLVGLTVCGQEDINTTKWDLFISLPQRPEEQIWIYDKQIGTVNLKRSLLAVLCMSGKRINDSRDSSETPAERRRSTCEISELQ